MIVHDPGNTEPKPVAWAWFSIDADGNEGLCGYPIGSLGVQPLVTTSAKNVPLMDGFARAIAKETGKAVRRVRFDSRVIEEEFTA